MQLTENSARALKFALLLSLSLLRSLSSEINSLLLCSTQELSQKARRFKMLQRSSHKLPFRHLQQLLLSVFEKRTWQIKGSGTARLSKLPKILKLQNVISGRTHTHTFQYLCRERKSVQSKSDNWATSSSASQIVAGNKVANVFLKSF